ncbi:MAG: zinc ABC transporter substrate-binding protein [Planctomycetota bacterium]
MREVRSLMLCMTLAMVTGCDVKSTTTSSAPMEAANAPRTWVATTGHVHDALAAITSGTDIKLKLLCGAGVDPHSYSASINDVQAMQDCGAIFYNGFHLEAKLHEELEGRFGDKSWAMASAFPESARLDWLEDGQVDPEAPFDPHIWNHLPGWTKCVQGLIDRVCQIDPANEMLYRENGAVYVDSLQQLHRDAEAEFAKIPPARRVLVSAHDAFNYFANVYGFETVAVLGIGNDAEADLRTMRDVAGVVIERRVPMIFLETITNPKVTDALKEACEAKDWSVQIADRPLYSDDLGSVPPEDTFIGAFRSNVRLISESLKASPALEEAGT